jgi:hypothetical protein
MRLWGAVFLAGCAQPAAVRAWPEPERWEMVQRPSPRRMSGDALMESGPSLFLQKIQPEGVLRVESTRTQVGAGESLEVEVAVRRDAPAPAYRVEIADRSAWLSVLGAESFDLGRGESARFRVTSGAPGGARLTLRARPLISGDRP